MTKDAEPAPNLVTGDVAADCLLAARIRKETATRDIIQSLAESSRREPLAHGRPSSAGAESIVKTTPPLSRPRLAVMAVGAGAGIANLYYNQPRDVLPDRQQYAPGDDSPSESL